MADRLDRKIRKWNHQRIILFRRWRMQILKWLLDQRLDPLAAPQRPEKGRDQLERIIILRTDGKLGDSITSTYLLKGLKAVLPNSHITVMSQPEFKNLFWGLSDDYIPFQLNFLNAIKFVSKNQQTYDLLINTSHILNPSSVLLSRYIPATKKIIFLNPTWRMFSHHVQFDVNNDHVTTRYNALLQLLSKKAIPQVSYSYQLDIQAQSLVTELLEQKKSQTPFDKIIVLNSFAGARLRNLSLTTTKSLVESVSAVYPNSLIVSIGNVGDLRVINRWQNEINCAQWTFFNYGSLEFNAALVARADLVITPDTSIVHMACALKRNLVAIYREDFNQERNQKIWAPFGTNFIVVEAAKLTPANEDGDINSVNIPEIVKAAQKLLPAGR